MNNNTKRYRSLASKEGTVTLSIPNKVSGNHGSEYGFRTQTIAIGRSVRLSKRPKIGGLGKN